MEATSQKKDERTYDVRILSHPKVKKALAIEQKNRHGAVDFNGSAPRKVDILADWVEEKADSIIDSEKE